MRTLLSMIMAVGIVGAATIAAADDPVERAAEKAANAKKDNKPKADRPQREPTQANRPDTGDGEPLVEPKASHGDKVAPIQAGAVNAHKKHHRRVDSDKFLHDPTDGGR